MFFPTCPTVVVGLTVPTAIIALSGGFYDTVSNRPEALVLEALGDYAARPRPCAGFEAPARSANEAIHASRRAHPIHRRIARKLTWV